MINIKASIHLSKYAEKILSSTNTLLENSCSLPPHIFTQNSLHFSPTTCMHPLIKTHKL